jgi:hypothetical protein
MFENKPTTPIFNRLKGASFEAAQSYFNTQTTDPDFRVHNMITSMMVGLTAGCGVMAVLLRDMPKTMKGVDQDILALDSLAFGISTLQQAVTTRRKQNYGDEAMERTWLESLGLARSTKVFFIDHLRPEVSEHFLARWNEFKAIESPHERFNALVYVLVTSKGHSTPMKRYPGAPPVLLDWESALEIGAELSVGNFILESVDEFRKLAAQMGPDEDDEED